MRHCYAEHLCIFAFLYYLFKISRATSPFTQEFQTEHPLWGDSSLKQKHLNVWIVGASMPKWCLAPERNSGETQGKSGFSYGFIKSGVRRNR